MVVGCCLKEVFEVPKLFNTRLREGGCRDLRSQVGEIDPKSIHNILPGSCEMRVQVITGVIPRPAWIEIEAAFNHMSVLLRELRALSQRCVDRGEGPFLLPRGVSRKKSGVRPGHSGSQWKMSIASRRDKGNMLERSSSFGDSIGLVGPAKNEINPGFDRLGT